MRTPVRAAARMRYTLCIFPYLTTARTTAAGAKSIPPGTAGTSPIGFAIGLPRTFGTADANIIHTKEIGAMEHKKRIYPLIRKHIIVGYIC